MGGMKGAALSANLGDVTERREASSEMMKIATGDFQITSTYWNAASRGS